MPKQQLPWYLHDRAISLSIVYLTRRDDIFVDRRSGSALNDGLDLIVGISENGKSTKYKFGVVARGIEQLEHSYPTLARGQKWLNSEELDAICNLEFPVYLFVFEMQNDQGFFSPVQTPDWDVMNGLREPKIEPSKRLTNETLAEIICDIKRWYSQPSPILDNLRQILEPIKELLLSPDFQTQPSEGSQIHWPDNFSESWKVYINNFLESKESLREFKLPKTGNFEQYIKVLELINSGCKTALEIGEKLDSPADDQDRYGQLLCEFLTTLNLVKRSKQKGSSYTYTLSDRGAAIVQNDEATQKRMFAAILLMYDPILLISLQLIQLSYKEPTNSLVEQIINKTSLQKSSYETKERQIMALRTLTIRANEFIDLPKRLELLPSSLQLSLPLTLDNQEDGNSSSDAQNSKRENIDIHLIENQKRR